MISLCNKDSYDIQNNSSIQYIFCSIYGLWSLASNQTNLQMHVNYNLTVANEIDLDKSMIFELYTNTEFLKN